MKPLAPRNRLLPLVPVAIALALSACASSDVSAIKGASSVEIDTIRVSDVAVELDIPKPSPGLKAALKDELEKAMPYCATGSVDHRMNVTVTDFEEQDVAKSIFIGDEIELEGTVEFVNAATGTSTGEYYVSNSFFWGGFIGAAMMSDAEQSLSEDFAENMCEELFDVDLEAAR